MKENPGIISLKVGTAALKSNFWTVYKTLDLDSVVKQVNDNDIEYNKLIEIVHKDYESYTEFIGIEKQIDLLSALCKNRLRQVLPCKIIKRAIFSPLGSLVKIISGNLDEEDAKKYDKEIDNLNGKEHSVESRVSLMQNAFTKIVNATDIINSNVDKISVKTHEMELALQSESKLGNVVSLITSMNQILNNFHFILNYIQEIETAIAFSKLQTLHQSIINSTELLDTLKHVEKHANLVYPVSIDNLVKIERSIVLKSFLNNDRLVFVLEIPLVYPEKYSYYKIVPIPIRNPETQKTITIIPKHPYLMVNRLNYRPVRRPCPEIEDNKSICSGDDLVPEPAESCIEDIMLLKENSTNCIQNFIQIEETKIQQMTKHHWLVYAVNNIIIMENCHEDTRKYSIKGTYILIPDNKCITQIGKTIIEGVTNTSEVNLQWSITKMPELRNNIKKEEDIQLDLRKVDFSDVRDIINSAKYSSSDNKNDNYIVLDRISLGTLCIYILIFIGIFACITYYLITRYRNHPKTPQDTPSDDSSLRGGGVKVPTPCHYSFISKTTSASQSRAQQ